MAMGTAQRGWQESIQPYQAYSGNRQADFNTMQQQAFNMAGNQQMPGQTGEASNIASMNAYGPSAQGQQGINMMDYAAMTGSNAGQETRGGNYAANQLLRQGQATPQGQYGMQGIANAMDASRSGRWTDPGTAGQYMDPYMQNVVDAQKREATRDFEQLSQNQRAQTGRKAVSVASAIVTDSAS